MNRKLLLSMLVLAVAVVAIPGQAAAATSTPYAVAPNLTIPFVVMGESASLDQFVGDAKIVQTSPLAGGFLRVDVRCNSLVACAGLVVGH